MHTTLNKYYSIGILFLIFVCSISSTSAQQQILCPPNLDFEQGNYANWEFYTGSCCPTNTPFYTGALPNRHEIMYGSGIDKYGGFPVVAPGGGSYSLKLGNDDAWANAERARFYVHVPTGAGAYTLIYRYAVVFQEPANHLHSEQPRFEVNVYDSTTGQKIACNSHNYLGSSSIPGFKKSNNPYKADVYYKDWTTATIDFAGLGGHTVAIDFATADCGKGAHFGYGYIDLSCAYFQVKNINCKPQPTITLDAPPGFQSYKWMDTTFSTLYGTSANLIIPTPSQTTKYAVIVAPYPGFGCLDTMYTTVIKTDLITNLSNDTVLCKGSSAFLKVESNTVGIPLTYQWAPSTGLSCTNCFNPVATPNQSTTYMITVTDSSGCSKRDLVNIVVRDAVDPEINTDKDSVCEFEHIVLTNKANNPNGVAYSWHTDNGSFSGNGSSEIRGGWDSLGIKKVILDIHNQGCVESDTIQITVKDQPLASFSTPDHSCLNQDIKMTVLEQNASYIWSIDEHSFPDRSYKEFLTLNWATLGEKNIKLYLDANNGCYDSLSATIDIHERPIAKISSQDDDICFDIPFKLSTPAGPRYTYSWKPPQYFDNNNDNEVTGFAERSGYIHLQVSNQWDCTARDSFYINSNSCCEVFMPDAFTPNNDGVNDRYLPVDADKHDIIQFLVLNRWGEVIYESKGRTSNGWDGKHRGTNAEMGTYHYSLRYLCRGRKEVQKKGNFILLR